MNPEPDTVYGTDYVGVQFRLFYVREIWSSGEDITTFRVRGVICTLALLLQNLIFSGRTFSLLRGCLHPQDRSGDRGGQL